MEGEESVAERLRAARAANDLQSIFEIVEEAGSGRAAIPRTQLCEAVKEIGKIKGHLEHNDTRGFKKSGKVRKEDVISACRRALSSMVCRCEEAGNNGGIRPSASNKPPARRRARNGRVRVF